MKGKKYIFNPIGKDKQKFLSFPNPNKWINNKINFNFNGLHKQKSNSLYKFSFCGLFTMEKSQTTQKLFSKYYFGYH